MPLRVKNASLSECVREALALPRGETLEHFIVATRMKDSPVRQQGCYQSPLLICQITWVLPWSVPRLECIPCRLFFCSPLPFSHPSLSHNNTTAKPFRTRSQLGDARADSDTSA